jgi:hypothetical protein
MSCHERGASDCQDGGNEGAEPARVPRRLSRFVLEETGLPRPDSVPEQEVA